MNRLAELVTRQRERLGLRGYELASALGKQPSFITRLEDGQVKRLPSPEEVAIMANVLRVSVAEIVEAAGYDIRPDSEHDDPDIAEIAEHARLVDWQTDPSRLPVIHAILRTWSEFDRNSLRRVAEDPPPYDE